MAVATQCHDSFVVLFWTSLGRRAKRDCLFVSYCVFRSWNKKEVLSNEDSGLSGIGSVSASVQGASQVRFQGVLVSGAGEVQVLEVHLLDPTDNLAIGSP